jgi:hypothetical protein
LPLSHSSGPCIGPFQCRQQQDQGHDEQGWPAQPHVRAPAIYCRLDSRLWNRKLTMKRGPRPKSDLGAGSRERSSSLGARKDRGLRPENILARRRFPGGSCAVDSSGWLIPARFAANRISYARPGSVRQPITVVARPGPTEAGRATLGEESLGTAQPRGSPFLHRALRPKSSATNWLLAR